MVRQQKASKVHEDRYPSCQGKDELVKHDMLDPPRYLRRTREDFRGKALSFGVLDWKQLEKWKDTNAEGSKGSSCCSYEETAASSLELDLSTGVVKRLEVDLKSQQHMRNHSFSLRSQAYSDAMDADTVMRMDQKGKRDHQLLSMKQKEHQVSPNKSLLKKELSNASELSSCISPGSETSSKLLSEASSTVECQDRRRDIEGECSSPVTVVERNQNFVEKPSLLDKNIHILTSKKGRDASPNRRFSFSFSQMSRSFSSKESSSHASAKSGPLTFNDSVYPNHHPTRTKPKGHSRTRSGPILIPKTEKRNVPLQVASKPSSNTTPPTMEKNQCRSRVHALLQFTLRKGINLFQFVVGDNNSNNVLAATMKSSDSSTRSYTLYTVNEVKNKSGNWLGRNKNEHPFVHTTIGHIKTVTSSTSDSSIHKSESVLFGPSTNEELAAIVQTRNMSQRHSKTTIILPSGVHTLPKDSNDAPLPLIERWKSGGACDCGGWDIGCKLRVISNDHSKSHTFSSSFQLFDQERDEPAFKIVSHGDELHSVEFGSSISLLEAFFISLAVTSHQSWCQKEEEEAAVLIGDGLLKRETPAKYATNPPVSPIGRV
ncbi:PREDICTED: uncharacterized protein LOC104782220 [Camelina sativa]|uniref:Uncharacterized protein LOC104782220 n=2 Tax=Camelina sativa TaxID=90675 RepID=A0ABM1RNA2_CAMSA|nr:PREDICTED: uncharacterized protein LOC104782220 [Camelina sativa]XP_019100491.1 PREDICTED: uncharacterized protein LOC104782220 [Camelina sativa]